MRCPYCGADDSKVIDSRPTEDGEKIRRRRECLSCHSHFTDCMIMKKVSLFFSQFATDIDFCLIVFILL